MINKSGFIKFITQRWYVYFIVRNVRMNEGGFLVELLKNDYFLFTNSDIYESFRQKL